MYSICFRKKQIRKKVESNQVEKKWNMYVVPPGYPSSGNPEKDKFWREKKK